MTPMRTILRYDLHDPAIDIGDCASPLTRLSD
jgi:hypothetical protein